MNITTIDQVIDKLQTYDAQLSDTDGIKWFNRLYLLVTKGVKDALYHDSAYVNPDWIKGLDILFANKYFQAIESTGVTCRAWRPVITARKDTSITRLQFALSGMNAHINHDLPLVLSESFAVGTPFSSSYHRDYERINNVIARVEQEAKQNFEVGMLANIADLGRLDDILAIWNIKAAREVAWVNGKIYHNLPALLRDEWSDALDASVGAIGRGLLVHV